MKKQVGTIGATPSKRLFLSIIADYDLSRSICELVNNGLGVWVRRWPGVENCNSDWAPTSGCQSAVILKPRQPFVRTSAQSTLP